MTPQEKRLKTIRERYGSVSNMLKKRDVRDLILGGYNGGIKRGRKGFATWEEGKLSEYASVRQRNSKGQFISKKEAQGESHPEAPTQ